MDAGYRIPKHMYFACRQSFEVRKLTVLEPLCLRLYGNKAGVWLSCLDHDKQPTAVLSAKHFTSETSKYAKLNEVEPAMHFAKLTYLEPLTYFEPDMQASAFWMPHPYFACPSFGFQMLLLVTRFDFSRSQSATIQTFIFDTALVKVRN
jgi:hypothetical protein